MNIPLQNFYNTICYKVWLSQFINKLDCDIINVIKYLTYQICIIRHIHPLTKDILMRFVDNKYISDDGVSYNMLINKPEYVELTETQISKHNIFYRYNQTLIMIYFSESNIRNIHYERTDCATIGVFDVFNKPMVITIY